MKIKKSLSLILVFIFLFLFSSCAPLSGTTEELDANPVKDIYSAYNDFYYGKREIDLSFVDSAPPDLGAIITSRLGVNTGRIDVSIANRSIFEVKFYGYAWVTENAEPDNTFKVIFYNEDKNVSNSTYTVTYQSGYGGVAPFSFIDKTTTITPDTIIFLFFTYRETEYVGGVKSDGSFIYWPKSQTYSEAVSAN